jgi:4-amino-4-deoxy-L-arabinose transferase-like glycosyltransferase
VSQDGPDRRLPFLFTAALLILLAWVLFNQLGVSGLLGPDEPRYASIGREMAASGDFLTPRLNGAPWYEKPPLLYWLTAAGFLAGLDSDLAPRVPVVLLSLAALGLWFLLISRLEGPARAMMMTTILASTAGWSALSMIAVTDLPLAACFSLALAFGVAAVERASRTATLWAGFFLGSAILAKGLVALMLLLPFCFLARASWRRLTVMFCVAAAVAAPWYALMTARHGWAFVDVFFMQHHFGRFSSEALQHVRPFWFYIPVLLAGVFPWTPLLGLLGRGAWTGPHSRVWVWTAAFGLLFFSLSTNKLPAYLLPLFPAFAVLMADALDRARSAGRTLALSMFLLALAPAIASVLPDALLNGLSRARMSEVHWEYFAAAAPPAFAVWLLDRRGRRLAAVFTVAACAMLALLFVKLSVAPVLGEIVSSRGLASKVSRNVAEACIETLHRNYRYGLDYYLNQTLPLCQDAPRRGLAIIQEPSRLPRVAPRQRPAILPAAAEP